MATRRKTSAKLTHSPRPPATTPEAREKQMVALAVELVEKQLIDGSATSQVIHHYLKLGSSREKLEQERLTHENELLQARTEALASAQRVEELYAVALSAMRAYAGHESQESDEDFDD